MLLVALLALGLVVATVVLHYEGLRLISQVTLSHRQIGRPLMMLVVFGVILLHVLDIALYGTGFWVAGTQWHLGSLHSSRPLEHWDYLYFAAEAFPCLGLGDVFPIGDLRALASVEALNGVIVLGWSGSFTFLMMQRLWIGRP